MTKSHNLTEGNILKSLMTFSIPIIISLFLQAMYGAVDLIVVGHFSSTADVSGVASGSLLLNTITISITGLAMGITVLVGEAIGKRDDKQSSGAITNGIFIFSILTVVLSLVITFGSGFFTEILKAPSEAFSQTKDYIFICGIGLVFIVSYNILGAVFRGIGDSKTPLITVAIACCVNIIGDLLLVAVFKLGAVGAALATVTSQSISVIISLFIIRKKKLPFKVVRGEKLINKYYIKKILLIGIPIALQDLLVGISFLAIQSVVNSLGIYESAGVGVGEKVSHFLMLLGSACMQAISAFVAQNLGAGKRKRALEALKQGIIVSVSAGLILGLCAFFFGDKISSIFDNDPLVIKQSHLYLKAYAFDCVLMPLLFSFLGYFNGSEKTLFVMIQGIVGAFLIRLPMVLILGTINDINLFYIGLATPCASAVQIIMASIYFFTTKKQFKSGELVYEQ